MSKCSRVPPPRSDSRPWRKLAAATAVRQQVFAETVGPREKPDKVGSMVSWPRPKAREPWVDAHFVGGHPILDFANTVVDRVRPAVDNELLRTPADVLTWCAAVSLFTSDSALSESALSDSALSELSVFSERAESEFVSDVREVRECAWAVFDAITRDEELPARSWGELLERAGVGARDGISYDGTGAGAVVRNGTKPGAIAAALSMVAVEARFTLPKERIRACGRCGWLFVDSSRGGRRRWCSMSACGNREKVSRHRQRD